MTVIIVDYEDDDGMGLILEVRYDKDGPMGEKTDRRVRYIQLFSRQRQKIHSQLRFHCCNVISSTLNDLDRITLSICHRQHQVLVLLFPLFFSCFSWSGLTQGISIRSNHFGLSSATLGTRSDHPCLHHSHFTIYYISISFSLLH